MRLKSLTLKGFKSFADETEINFNENLIGIVGPNGSGKSNIVDAIRWVLGEQKTTELRLEAMADVIFNGTDERKAGRVARVTLTFDNTKHVLPVEYTEVSISRLLYRDGNSEYRLNNVPCRKKDITSLFIDSGIGSNSYAIISLHMVEDILTDNGQSRRRMLEQAAGVTKYKTRKRETLSKLASTAEDLDRVEDLLYEIKKNMKAFERQARRTEQYNTLRKEYMTLSIAIATEDIKAKKASIDTFKKQLAGEEDQALKLSADLHTKESALQQAKQAILVHEQSLSQDQQAYNRSIEKLGKLENEKNLTKQKIDNARSRLVTIDDRLERYTAQYQEIDQTIDGLSHDIAEAQTVFTELEQAHLNAQALAKDAAATYHALRQEEKAMNDSRMAFEGRFNELTAQIQRTEARQLLFGEDLVSLDEKMAASSELILQKEAALHTLDARRQDLEERIAQKVETLETRQVGLQADHDALSALQKEVNTKELELASLKQRIGFLENIVNKQEGVSEAVKFIRQAGHKDIPVLADVMQVADQDLGPVVELFFEPLLSTLIAADSYSARKLYQQVRQAQKGQVNVLISDRIDDIQQHDTSTIPHGCYPLIDVLKFAPAHDHLIRFLVNHVYISRVPVDQFEETELSPQQIVLFPQDYLILSGHQLKGGSNTLFQGVQLGRKQMIEELKKQEARTVAKLDSLHQQVADQSQKIHMAEEAAQPEKASLEELRQTREAWSREAYELTSHIHMQEDRIKTLLQEKTQKTAESGQAEATLAELKSQVKAMEDVRHSASSGEDLGNRIESAYASLQHANAKKEETQQAFYQSRSGLDIMKKDLENQGQNRVTLDTQQRQLSTERTAIESQLVELRAALVSFEGQLDKQYLEKEALQAKLNTYEDTYYQEKGRIFESEKKISELRRAIATRETAIAQLKDRISNLTFDAKSITDRLDIEFGESYRDSDITVTPDGSPAEWKPRQKELRDKISRFGEINPMAITAYNEIKERHEHISGERDDILNAKKALEETIAEIEETAARQFTEAVDAVRVNFKRVFQSLFSEDDDCDVVILNPDDPLESNIEIIAKPKGKRPTSIHLLSGGEKALTAASFLFALYLLKPAPFCIFDEVDAPLDDVNIQKFNQLIRRFSEESQFIIITHNKLTMAEVDVLYGIFLKEKGVSGVSAVDFRSYEAAEILEAPGG